MIHFTREGQQVLPSTLGTIFKVHGADGASCNVFDSMVMEGSKGFELMALDTDTRALMNEGAPDCLQLGARLTCGLSAGGDPEVVSNAALESTEAVLSAARDQTPVFLTPPWESTGFGATTQVASIACQEAMVIASATLPFSFEGRRHVDKAVGGLEELRQPIFLVRRTARYPLIRTNHEKQFPSSCELWRTTYL